MSENLHRNLCCLFALVLLAGCTAIFPERGSHPPDSEDARYRPGSPEADIHSLTAYASDFSQMTADAQRKELEAAELAFAREDGSMQRLRLALLLSYADGELQDLDRASELLARPAARPGTAADHGLAELLAPLVARMQAEQRRAGSEVQASSDAHQASRAADSSAQQQELRRLEAMLAAERAQCRALEEQLRSLKDIERQINEREQPPSLPLDDDYDPTQDFAGR
jgi:hypothetical protein